jgi:hypothetical protein
VTAVNDDWQRCHPVSDQFAIAAAISSKWNGHDQKKLAQWCLTNYVLRHLQSHETGESRSDLAIAALPIFSHGLENV